MIERTDKNYFREIKSSPSPLGKTPTVAWTAAAPAQLATATAASTPQPVITLLVSSSSILKCLLVFFHSDVDVHGGVGNVNNLSSIDLAKQLSSSVKQSDLFQSQ